MSEAPIDQIRPSPYQPRLHFELESLKESIRRDGMLVTPVVRRKPNNETEYELIDGERRWRAAQELGWNTIPIQVIEVDEETARRMVFTLNEERQSYNAEEYTKFYRRMYEQMGSANAVAKAFKKHPQTILNYVHISILPEPLQKAVWAGKIPIGFIQELEPIFSEAKNEIGDIYNVINYSSSPSYNRIVGICEQIYLKQIQSRQELRKEYVDPYLESLDKKRVEKAKEEIQKAVPNDFVEASISLETPEDYEKAAEALLKEAERLKTPEQIAEEERRKAIAQARRMLTRTRTKIDRAAKIVETNNFLKQLNLIEESLMNNPFEVEEQLSNLSNKIDEVRKKRERELEEERHRREEEARKRRLEEERARIREEEKQRLREEAERKAREIRDAEMRRLEEEARKKAEEEMKRRFEAERKLIEEEMRQKLLEDRELLEKAEEKLKKIRFEELKARKKEEQVVKRPQINVLNELTGGEWLKFTKSWYIFDALESDLAEERVITAGLTEEHPATFSPTMISDYVRFFTKKDAVVLDPFVGIGSTLVASSRARRKGIGIDINEQYVEIARKRIEGDPNQKVIHGDAWDIEKYDLPKIDYCVTSPPYFRMLGKIDVTQKRRIRKGLATDYGDSVVLPEKIDEYINNLVDLFSKIAKITSENGYLTVIIQNFRDRGRMIPLAWQFAIAIQERGDWVFKGEKLWLQDHKKLHPFGQKFDFVSNIHHHYCLIFKRA